MIQLKNSEIATLCANLFNQVSVEGNNVFGGLLTEEVTLGLKRRLEKIRVAAMKLYDQYVKDREAIKIAIVEKAIAKLPEGSASEEYKEAEKGSDKFIIWQAILSSFDAELLKEYSELDEEIVTISQEKVSLLLIEKIETKANYDWEILEKIAS